MVLSSDPSKIPPERGWEVRPIFSGIECDPNYLAALMELVRDSDAAGHSDIGVRNFLFTLILGFRPESVLEVGGHIGSATLVMGEGLRLNGYGTLHTLEPLEHYYTRLNYYIDKAGLRGIVNPIKGFSYDPEIKRKLAIIAPFELIFIDACHDYSAAIHDVIYSISLLAEYGLIILHDSSVYAQSFDSRGEGGVRRAIIESCRQYPELQAVFFEYPLWLNPCGAAILCKQGILDSSKKKNLLQSLFAVKGS